MFKEISLSILNKNGAIAGAAIVSPVWLDILKMISEVATITLPILGGSWLIMQMGFATWNQIRKVKGSDEKDS